MTPGEQDDHAPMPDNAAQPSTPEPVDWEEQVAYLRGLAHIMEQEHLSELEVDSQGIRYTLRGPGSLAPVKPAADSAEGEHFVADTIHYEDEDEIETEDTGEAPESDLVPVVSPMVGVFYRAGTPSDPPFVEVGEHIEPGHTVGLVEAMKVFNEITSEVEGTVINIVAQNGDLVEAGSTLMWLRP